MVKQTVRRLILAFNNHIFLYLFRLFKSNYHTDDFLIMRDEWINLDELKKILNGVV